MGQGGQDPEADRARHEPDGGDDQQRPAREHPESEGSEPGRELHDVSPRPGEAGAQSSIGTEDWGPGTGDWGLGTGDSAETPLSERGISSAVEASRPSPQSQSPQFSGSRS